MPDLLKCRRCRWVGAHAELREVKDRKIFGLYNNVCPRCGCKTFTDAQEPKNG